MKRLLLALLSILFLAACSSAAETQPIAAATIIPTVAPKTTPIPTQTALPSATPLGGGQGKIIFLKDNANEESWDIFSMNSDGTGIKQLTTMEGIISHPVWSPDGEKIAFAYKENKDSYSQLYVKNSDRSGLTKISMDDQKNYNYPAWSPDGSKILFQSNLNNSNSKWSIFAMNADGTNEVQITDDQFISMEPDWSPDGSKIVYVSTNRNAPDIFVMNADGAHAFDKLHVPKF